ncbi:hypothetical protein LOTGIDRAFT_166153 [Lottia gigantea]|uniref:Uncharacterized protein n=1 Tax=Lottia gigantea TaxID=225164 RepID=V3ZU30_LOTGI|nr:hypothetical protein LOTGIDRAFT_166153 [Lottia gigantea]ESO87852.1 hypothetical protein LOTGIDRAFT_166153 [Lottia gigantea]
MASSHQLSPRTPADGCESLEYTDTDILEYSFEDIVPYIKIVHIKNATTYMEDSHDKKAHLSKKMHDLSVKQAALKKKDSALYEKHRQIKKRLHDFLNTTDVQTKLKKSKSFSQIQKVLTQCAAPFKLVTILKNGKKCTFC